MTHPIKWRTALTQACIDLHNAKSQSDIQQVREQQLAFEQSGYPFPPWFNTWLEWAEKYPMLSAEEVFKRPAVRLPGFEGMGVRIKKEQVETHHRKVDAAIRAAACDDHPVKRNLAYIIASRILSTGDDGCQDGLAYEWHSQTDEFESLTNQDNFQLFVEMLQRETAFWVDDVKASGHKTIKVQNRPSSAGLPSF